MANETTQNTAKSTSTSSATRSSRKTAQAGANRKKAPKKASAKRTRRKQSSPGDRQRILAVATREGLTALDVQKRFGVKPVTYYSWRKKLGLKGPRGRKAVNSQQRSPGTGKLVGRDFAAQVRQALRGEITRLLPTLIQEEVAGMIGGVGGRRRK